MDDFRNLFHRILSFLGVYGTEAENVFKTFFYQVYAAFVDDVLKSELPEEVYNNRIKEYQNYIKEGKQELLHQDLKFYIGKDVQSKFALTYMELLKRFIHGIHEQGDISQEQVDQVGQIIGNFFASKKVSAAMKNEGSSVDSLKAIL